MTSSRIAEVRRKIERAREHIVHLVAERRAFFDTDPYELVRTYDPQSHRTAIRLARTPCIPANISLIAGDAIHNLRSALDYLVWKLAVNPLKPRQVDFPVYESFKKFDNQFPRKVKVMGIPHEVANAIKACKPYKGGNDALWLLNELNNIDKHRLLLTVYATPAKMAMTIDHRALQSYFPELFGQAIDTIVRGFPTFTLDEGVLYVEGNRTHPADFQLSFDISLRESQVRSGEPLLVTLEGMVDLVSQLVADFEPFFA
jgi:hypothetical protein